MLEIVKSNFKRTLKSATVIFIIFIMLMQSYIWTHDSKASQLDRTFTGFDFYNHKQFSWDILKHEDKKKESLTAYNSGLKFIDMYERLKLAHIENDIQKITHLESLNILMMKRLGSDGHPLSLEFKEEAIDLWNQVSEGITYDSINFATQRSQQENPYDENDILIAKLYYYLNENELEPLYKDDIKDITFLIYYFNDIFPYMIFVGVALLWYNAINKEKSTGSLKLILTQSVSRKKYYLSKWFSGVLSISSIFIIPPLLISIVVGLLYGSTSWIYPLRMYQNTWTSFIPLKEPFYWGGVRLFVNKHNTPFGTEIVPFYEYLLSMIVLAVLFIGFLVALTQLVSALINNERLSLLVVGSAYGISLSLSKLTVSKFGLNLMPTGLHNVCKTVGGNQHVTALGASVILIVGITVTLGISMKYFNKKQI